MADSFELTAFFPVPPRRIYDAWLNGEEHGAMTHGEATGEPRVDAKFTAWGDYIQGTNLELEPYRRIAQSWRTTEFPPDAPDSRLELLLDESEGGTTLILRHTAIPSGQSEEYEQGWRDYYFEPMREYFSQEKA